jgi:hypothetical protein
MAERILPSPDAYATCPNEGKILEYYSGTFEAVYTSFFILSSSPYPSGQSNSLRQRIRTALHWFRTAFRFPGPRLQRKRDFRLSPQSISASAR